MLDITKTIEAKSDQLNADDLIGTSKVLTITEVKLGSAEQPIILHYEGDEGKPYKPSKGMRRVLVAGWGTDGHSYVGRALRVYNDPTVKYAGKEVGGIRISEMSDLANAISIPLTLTRGKKIAFIVKPLKTEAPAEREMTMEERQLKTLEILKKNGVEVLDDVKEIVMGTSTPEELKDIYTTLTTKEEEVE